MATEFNEITITNLNEQEKGEFERIYRILTSDMGELKKSVSQQQYALEDAENDVQSLEALIALGREHGDENVRKFVENLSKNVERNKQYVADMYGQLEEYKERLERAQAFFDDFKAQIVIDEDGNGTVTDRAMFLVEYLNSLGNILEPDEREEAQRKQQQQQQ